MPRRHIAREAVDAPLLGDEQELQGAALSAMQETEDFERKEKTMRDHRRRINCVVDWLQENAPEYFAVGVVSTTSEDRDNPRRHLYGAQRDLKYTGLHVSFIKAFIASKKIKSNGMHSSFANLRKYHDAVLFGAERAKTPLPPSYLEQMPTFLLSCKKEAVVAKRNGTLDEQEADPISFELYKKICGWMIEANDIFAWAWMTTEWNLMARTASVELLGLCNMKTSVDAIVIKFYDSKMDGGGDKVTPKHCYANPIDPSICMFTALGCYLATKGEIVTTTRIFGGNYCSEYQ